MATPKGYKTQHQGTGRLEGKHCITCDFEVALYSCSFPKGTGRECDFDNAIIFKKISIKKILSKL